MILWKVLLDIKPPTRSVASASITSTTCARKKLKHLKLQYLKSTRLNCIRGRRNHNLIARMKQSGIVLVAYNSLASTSMWRAGQGGPKTVEISSDNHIFAEHAAKCGTTSEQFLLEGASRMASLRYPKTLGWNAYFSILIWENSRPVMNL